VKPNLVSIVIPVYNEEQAIGDDLDLIIKTMEASDYDYEIIVVDDGSTDSSADIVRQRSQVKLIRHPYNRGTGAARTTGIKQAEGEVIVMTDGDGTYPNQDIPRLLGYMDEYDMVVGARRREAGTLRWLRSPVKHLIRLLASYLVGMRIPDLNSGFRAFGRDAALSFVNILPTTHSWVGTITLAHLTNGYTVKFMPIDYYERKGRSSFHPLRDTYNYLSMVVRTITYFNPLKIFLPASLVLFTLGGGKTIFDLILHHRTRESDVIMVVVSILIFAIGLLADLIVAQHRER
jgi:glycosyltransferase involved in cell wall biosynthesis